MEQELIHWCSGLANNCLDVADICQGKLKLPGLWEIPMYATFENDNAAGIHLMVRCPCGARFQEPS